MGMSESELERALHVAMPPAHPTGRSKYGMGMKTAACWIGNSWSIRTKKLGETTEHFVEIDVERIAQGDGQIPHSTTEGLDASSHYTIIEIREHNRKFQGRTISKIGDFLRSMYREDFRGGVLTLEWRGVPLTWREPKLLRAHDGTHYRKPFHFVVAGKEVSGWVGILERGSRAEAGFSIIHAGRVVRGWPDSWRPSSLYGQLQGSNDLVNQRLVGEIHLDEFDVSHTKDDILWLGDEEELVEEQLRIQCNDYREIAREYRRNQDDERGPSELEAQIAIDEIRRELESPEMVDAITIGIVPPLQVVEKTVETLAETVTPRDETFRVEITDANLLVSGYLTDDFSPNDPYVVVESTNPARVAVIVNTAHPHWGQLKGSDGVLNYLRHCTYDAIAEWQARQKVGRVDPHTIKFLKDRLLRIPLQIEMTTTEPSTAENVLQHG